MGPGRVAGAWRAGRVDAHGMVPPAGRFGGDLRSRGAATWCAVDVDARLRARLRPLPRVDRTRDPRPVRAARASLCDGHGISAWDGARSGPRRTWCGRG